MSDGGKGERWGKGEQWGTACEGVQRGKECHKDLYEME